ncbi:MAG: glycoside hydrolase family 27 protein [Bacteroidia bacterium]|nr:glycoside hydrolase family 27 protein [Bacteroidia bacterium]
MGWMSWNFFGDNITEQSIKEMADAMVASGMRDAGYTYIFIDDGWQGGRDNKNNLIADAKKFPSGIKALADYVHSKGLKLGIYSDAALLTCAGYTASLHFEEQDAKTFATWQVDYLKYDYCHAPIDSNTAKSRYLTMSDALKKTNRQILFGICEWGERQPWLWAAQAGGHLWRTTLDIRDKWQMKPTETWGLGIMDILDANAGLHKYAGPGHWNDADMLIAGLYGKKGPSADGGGTGCSDTEYQSQFSIWALMAAPLYASNDLRNMNEATKKILLNADIIAINQDTLGKQAVRIINDSVWNVFVKPLHNGDYAVAILNKSEAQKNCNLSFASLGLKHKYQIKDLWLHKNVGHGKIYNGIIQSHETKVFRLKTIYE